MGLVHLSVFVLEQVGHAAMKHTHIPGDQGRGVFTCVNTSTTCLDTHQLYAFVPDEFVEQAHRVGSTPDTSYRVVGQSANSGKKLLAGLPAYDGLKVSHHLGIWMRPHHAAYEVVRGLDVGDPVAYRLVDRILERSAATGDRANFCPEQAHPENVQGLALDVLLAHIDNALLVKHGAHGGSGYAMLPRARLGDDATLAHALRKKALPQSVVDLVRARVSQVFTLDEDVRAAKFARQVLGVVQLCWPAHVVAGERLEPCLELLVRSGRLVLGFEFVNRAHERLGDKHTPELSEPSPFIR